VLEHPTRVGNRLLAALPPADFNLLAPYLRNVSLERDVVLVRSGERIEQIYFPCSATISFMLDMPNGQTVATAVIGNEAAVGVLSALGPSRSAATAVVLVAGTSLQNFSCTISCGLHPQRRNQECGPGPHRGPADAIPVRGRLQCATLGRRPLGAVAAPHPRSS